MKLRTLLIVAAVVYLLFAIALLLVPGVMESAYGTSGNAGEMLSDRMFGSALLAFGVLFWLSRDFTGASARPLITAALVGEVVFFLVALMGTLGGVMGATGWSAVVLGLVFALGFGYYQFVAPPK
jgi:hypothetical protein